MNNVLIVHAHPEPQSFCTAMAHAAAESFTAQDASVTWSDLYAEHFNPVASVDDFQTRANPDYLVYSLEQRHAYADDTLSAEIRREVDRVLACDTLVMVFPLYWFSTPAILKGWIDRVFLSGAFYGGKRIYERGSMRGRRVAVGITLGGREHMFGPGAIHGELAMGMLRHFFQGTLGYVGFDVLEPFFAYHVPYCSPEERAATMTQWRDYLARVDVAPTLTMPALQNFDDVFRPLGESKN
jgi:NAD(P)H dehydrogenase (quinone)